MSHEIICPSCHRSHTPHIRVVAETSRRAGRRPATPELINICPHCNALVILVLVPAADHAETR